MLGINSLTKSQELPNIDSLLQEDMRIKNYQFKETEPDSWRKTESIIIYCIDTLLKNNNSLPYRNNEKIIAFVLEYSQKGPFAYPIEDSLAMKLMKVDSEIWTYYTIGMVYYNLKMNQKEPTIEDIQINGLQFMLDYISNEKNITKNSSLNYKSVSENQFLKELQILKQNNQLREVIQKK